MQISLPDGTKLKLDDGATGAAAAGAIGEGLARAALGIRVSRNGGPPELRDLAAPLSDGDGIEIGTNRSGEDGMGPPGALRPPPGRGRRGPAVARPPRRGSRAGRGGAGALPRREDLDRAADRERLLLRLRLPRGR